MPTIPFYGAEHPDLFAIERAAMDRQGRVLAMLDERLPAGMVLDVGAGDGFTARRLGSGQRAVVPLEPSIEMVSERDLPWVVGRAERLPFGDATFDAAYATWAYFFPKYHDPTPGLDELHRVVRRGGPILIVDNYGEDEFTALAKTDITADRQFWTARGFDCDVIETAFEFDTTEDAERLLRLYFGEVPVLRALSFNVAVFASTSRGPSAG